MTKRQLQLKMRRNGFLCQYHINIRHPPNPEMSSGALKFFQTAFTRLYVRCRWYFPKGSCIRRDRAGKYGTKTQDPSLNAQEKPSSFMALNIFGRHISYRVLS